MTTYYPKGHPMARKMRERAAAAAKRAAQPPKPKVVYSTPEVAAEFASEMAEHDKLVEARFLERLNLPVRDQAVADAVVATIAAERRKRPFG
jgi:hypothetical protein